MRIHPADPSLAQYPVWDRISVPAAAGADLNALWFREDESEGLVVGANRLILHRDRKNGWHADSVTGPRETVWRAVAGAVDTPLAFVVGDGGWIAHRDGEHHWTAVQAGPAGRNLNSVWLDPAGQEGYAAGDGGVLLRYAGGRWSTAAPGSVLTKDLTDVAANDNEVWVRDADYTITRFARDGLRPLGTIPNYGVTRLWSTARPSTLWFSGVRLPNPRLEDWYTIRWYAEGRYDSVLQVPFPARAGALSAASHRGVAAGNWTRYDIPKSRLAYITPFGSFMWEPPDSAEIRALWVNSSVTRGWTVGARGFIGQMRQRQLPVPGMTWRFGRIEQLDGQYLIQVDSSAAVASLDSISLIGERDTVLLLRGRDFTAESKRSQIELELGAFGQRRASKVSGQQVRLTFFIGYGVSEPPYVVAYAAAKPVAYQQLGFWSKNRRWLLPVLILAGDLLGCLLLLLLARRFWSLRKWLFKPTLFLEVPWFSLGTPFVKAAHLIAAGSSWARLGLFRGDYLRSVAALQPRGPYTPPAFKVQKPGWIDSTFDGDAPDAAVKLYDALRKEPRGRVLWVVDPEGDQSSDLLRFWLQLSRERGDIGTPVELHDAESIRDKVAYQWVWHRGAPKEAIWLLDEGGFVILVDAATYGDTASEKTSAFVQDARLANTVIICSRSEAPPAVVEAAVVRLQ